MFPVGEYLNSFLEAAAFDLENNPNQLFKLIFGENVTVTSEKCMVDPWIIRYPCMVKIYFISNVLIVSGS
jgi:hypothetical protein